MGRGEGVTRLRKLRRGKLLDLEKGGRGEGVKV